MNCIKTLLLLATLNTLSAHAFSDKVLYGKDNRLDYYQIKNSKLKSIANATVALFESYDLDEKGNSYQIYNPTSIGEDRNLCISEPFYNQPAASFCSGFLINKDTIVTAGHCVTTQYECESKYFVFGYHASSKTKTRTKFNKNYVFSCKQLVSRMQDDAGADWAVIRLDRAVKNITPVKLSKKNNVKKGDPIYVIGYPAGLPLKVAAGANVRSVESSYYVANLDTYGGNSGSAVFNAKTNTVTGILVRGENDFENSSNFCKVSYQCDNNDCRGEDVTHINQICKGAPTLCKILGVK